MHVAAWRQHRCQNLTQKAELGMFEEHVNTVRLQGGRKTACRAHAVTIAPRLSQAARM